MTDGAGNSSPPPYTFPNVGDVTAITVNVTPVGLSSSASVSRVEFISFDETTVTVNPASVPASPYSATVTAVGELWAYVAGKAILSDGNTCSIYFGFFTPPVPTYSISGRFFNDVNQDTKSVWESNYTGGFTVSSSSGVITTNPWGIYQISGLLTAKQPTTIQFSGLSAGWDFTYPTSPITVSVGTTCYYPANSEGKCSVGDAGPGGNCTSSSHAGCSGDITNLNV
jgi:hypothetical protein